MLMLPRHRGSSRRFSFQQMLTLQLLKLDEAHLRMLMSAVNSNPGDELCAPFARPRRSPSSITSTSPLLTSTSYPSCPLILHNKGPSNLRLRQLRGAMLRAGMEAAGVGSSVCSYLSSITPYPSPLFLSLLQRVCALWGALQAEAPLHQLAYGSGTSAAIACTISVTPVCSSGCREHEREGRRSGQGRVAAAGAGRVAESAPTESVVHAWMTVELQALMKPLVTARPPLIARPPLTGTPRPPVVARLSALAEAARPFLFDRAFAFAVRLFSFAHPQPAAGAAAAGAGKQQAVGREEQSKGPGSAIGRESGKEGAGDGGGASENSQGQMGVVGSREAAEGGACGVEQAGGEQPWQAVAHGGRGSGEHDGEGRQGAGGVRRGGKEQLAVGEGRWRRVVVEERASEDVFGELEGAEDGGDDGGDDFNGDWDE
ncbi:unnamed protein product [Closterium sp. Naga37s-1]|nr:unnamed protein product [Closterium sp. Naga37s-1]